MESVNRYYKEVPQTDTNGKVVTERIKGKDEPVMVPGTNLPGTLGKFYLNMLPHVRQGLIRDEMLVELVEVMKPLYDSVNKLEAAASKAAALKA
ncbi:MAG TPA: hypothetical protein VJ873_09410 [bacterium]|nr:hypothetical protein [bacterium]